MRRVYKSAVCLVLFLGGACCGWGLRAMIAYLDNYSRDMQSRQIMMMLHDQLEELVDIGDMDLMRKYLKSIEPGIMKIILTRKRTSLDIDFFYEWDDVMRERKGDPLK